MDRAGFFLQQDLLRHVWSRIREIDKNSTRKNLRGE